MTVLAGVLGFASASVSYFLSGLGWACLLVIGSVHFIISQYLLLKLPSLVIASLLYTISYDSLLNLPSHTPSEPSSLFSLFDLFQASLLLALILSIFLLALSLRGAERAPGYLITWFQMISCMALQLIFLCRIFHEISINHDSLLVLSAVLMTLQSVLLNIYNG